MKTATGVVLVGMAISLIVCGGHGAPGGSVSASPQSPTPDTKPTYGGGDAAPIPQDKEVTISTDGRTLRVKSNDALIHVDRPLRFTAQGLRDGLSIEIDFEAAESHYKSSSHYVKGPFPRVEHPANPVRGRFLLTDKYPRVDAGAADTAGYFKYHVVLRNAKNEDIAVLDPGVLVKNDY